MIENDLNEEARPLPWLSYTAHNVNQCPTVGMSGTIDRSDISCYFLLGCTQIDAGTI